MRLYYFWFLLFGVSTFSLFLPHIIIIIIVIVIPIIIIITIIIIIIIIIKNNIILYTIIGFYLSLYALTLNVIINTRFFKGSISPAALAVP